MKVSPDGRAPNDVAAETNMNKNGTIVYRRGSKFSAAQPARGDGRVKDRLRTRA
jgi:hypothetical protein